MISSTNNAPAIAIAQGEKWNILLKRNNTKNSIKSSIDGEGYKRNNEVNDTPKQNLSQIFSNIFGSKPEMTINNSKTGSFLLEEFQSFFSRRRFKYSVGSFHNLNDNTIDPMDVTFKNGKCVQSLDRIHLNRLRSSKSVNNNNNNAMDVTRNTMNNFEEKSEKCVEASQSITDQRVKHAALDPDQLEKFKRFKRPSLCDANNLVRERALDVDMIENELRLTSSNDLEEIDLFSICNVAPQVDEQNDHRYNLL